ncbi:MAG: hypothetical protein K1X71_19040 [Pirellulales bacterium]|nr:hypothetical protein [Pirellulales bacterium]
MSHTTTCWVLSRLAIVVAVLAVAPYAHGGATADQPAAAQPSQWIAQLGDDSFAVRQRATRELEQLGRAAKEALLTGLKNQDPEIRARCRRILAVVLDLDLEARLSRFAAATDSAAPLDQPLPGWVRFEQQIGGDIRARQLFVEMLRAEAHLFEASEGDPKLLGPLLQARCEQLQQSAFESDARNRKLVSVGSVAALFFIGSHPEVTTGDSFVSYLHTFSYQPTFQAAMLNSDKAESLRKILGSWISRPAGAINSYQNFMLSLQFGLKEGLSPAMTMLRDGGAQPHMAQYAMLLVGRFAGKKEGLPLIAPFLTDHSLLGSYSINDQEVRTELRDVALAVLVHLTEQDHASYGFDHLQKNGQTVFQPVTAGFSDPAKRAAAFQRWNEWSMAHPQ